MPGEINRWLEVAFLIFLVFVFPIGSLLLVDWLAGISARRVMRDYEEKTGEKWPYPLDKSV